MGDRKPFVVIPIGDIQWAGDSKQVALDQLKATIARGMEKDAWFVGMGDFIDFMSPSNRQRITGAALYDSAMDVIDNAATDLVQELYEKVLKPTKGRWLGCVPLDTRILTQRGWRKHDELIIGELVLGYDSEREICSWTPLRGIVKYNSEPLMRLTSMSFDVIATPDHRWCVESQVHIDGNSYGPRYRKQFIKRTDTLKTYDHIRVAAPAEDGNHPLTSREAAVLGWIITDGTIFWHPTHPFRTQAFIYQSKPWMVKKIRKLLGKDATEKIDKRKSALIGTRVIHRNYPNYRFYIRKRFLWSLFRRANFNCAESLMNLIPQLTVSARRSMFRAMRYAEGVHGAWPQNPGPVLEAFMLLATLEGYRLGRQTPKLPWKAVTVNAGSRCFATVADMVRRYEGVGSVWCPQTDLQTWVMRQGDQITITGNCVEGHHFSHLKTGETTDMALCRLLDTKFLGTSAFIRLRFEFGERDRKTNGFCGNVILWVHHGTGSGIKAHAPLNKIENIAPYFDADIFLLGHMSKLATAPINRIYPRWDGKHGGDLVHRKVFLVGTGGYSKAYVEQRKDGNVPRDNYVGQKMLNPASLGSPTIYMYPQMRTKQENNVGIRWFDPTISVEI